MGDGPKKKKPIEDPRSEFFCTFVRKSMNLKADKLAKMMSSDENREIINEFLNNPENDLLICSKNQGGALSVQLKIPTSMAVGKCCYFRRTTINPLTLQNMGKELIYGDISCNPIENLTVVDEVMFPALNNPMNQVGWPNVLINSVTSKIQEFRNINTEIKGNMINRTLLPLPVTIDQAIKIAVKIKNDPNECDLKLKTSLELIVSKWSDQIEGILPADINILYENGMNPIPTDEMDFWNKRQLNLENILQQLRSVKIRTIARILEAVKSLHFNTFKTIFKNIVCALCETRDITLYLNPFRREVEKFQMTDFSDTKLYICPMLHVICLIWTNSEYYSTNDHISNLFRMINNMMIEEATKYLDPSSLFQGEITDILKKITESIDILKYYYARYRYYRNHLQDFKKPKTEIKLWTFNESPTFDRLNLFMTRLENILDVFNLANEFSKLEKIEVGGLNGKNIKRNLMKINEEFVELMHNWQNIQFDPLDPNPKTTDFDDVMTLFRETVDILERKLSYQINLAFDDCFSLDQATKLIQVLSTLLYVPIIRREIVPRFYDIIEMFNKELDLIKINFDDGKQNINEPIRTPIDNGFPPISGKIGWLLKIRNRITNHLSNLQIIDYFMNDTDEGVHAISKANEMLKIIDEYASEIFLPWSKQTIGDAGKCLKKYILTRNEDGLLAVNFDRILVTTLKEVKNLKLMNCEKYHKIPSGLLAISEQEEYFWDARIKLSRIVEWHTYIRNNTIDCEFNLIKHEMVKIDSSLEPGIKCDDWNHIDQDFIEKNYNLLKNLHSRIVKSQENVKMILDYINSWASIPTFHRKDNLPNSLLNFDDRKNILINRMNNYEQSSTIINEAMVLNYKLFSDTMESEPIPQEQEDEVVENNDDTISRSVEASETSNQEIISNVQSTDELDLIDSKLWLAYQEYVDALIGKEILNGITTSIRYIKNEISDVHQNNIPLVEVQYTLNAENHPTFIPELDENLPNSLLKKFEKMMRDIFTICYLIPRIVQPKEIKLNDDGEPIFNNFIHLLDSQTDIDNMQIDIFTQVKATTNEALAAYKVYMDYKHLWEVDRTEYLKQFLIYGRMLTESELNKIDDVKKASPSLNKFKEEIDRYTELLEEIKKFEKFKEFNIWLRINQQPFNMGCLSLASKWISLFKNHLIERVVDGLQELEDFIKESRDILSMTIDNDDLNGLLKVMNVIQQIDQRNLNVLKMFDVIKETIELLKEYDIIFNDNVDKVGGQLLMLPEDWNKLTKMALTVTQTIGPVKAYQIGLSEKRIELFNLQTKNYREKFINMPFFFAPCKNVYKLIDKTKKDLLQFEDSYNKLIDTVGIFKITPPNQTQLVVCSDELVLVKILWDFFKVVSTTVDKWKTTPWAKINVDSIETDCKQFVKDMRQLDKATRTWEPYIFIDTSIKNLMTSLRSIIELQNPAVRERHWNELMSETSLQFEMNDSMTLKELFDLNLHFYEEEIKNIVDKSVKEMAMEKGLAIIETTWRDMEFEYDVHDRTQTKIIRPSEELVEVLVDNQVQIQSMLSSKYKRFFEAQITDWQIKLSKADAVISAWFEVQRKWVYLESIFIASDDIRKQLTQEALRFDGVDEKFKKLLQEIYSDNNVISATNKSHILQSLETLQTDLVKCEKALNDYLETKRLAYPRFYFISSVDLLDILSNSNNPAMVAKHLTKLYDSLAHLKFDGSKRAIEMISKENEEHVKFLSPCDCSGNVEVWLNRITDTMRGTLRNLFNEANAAYESRPREKLILDFPAQPALCTTQIWWAVETNSAFAQIFKGNENALKDYNREQISQLNALINLLLGDLTVGDRQKIMTVCTIDVHSRDVVAKMIAQGIDTVTSFQWQSQLRHRWDKKLRDCFANICDAQFKYDYEYLGNTPRLVITPLTDRCYITLTQSLHLIMGGAPAGPAGTGKTETTKDLGRALGIMVYVFNCSDQMDYKSCANIYKGLAQTGAWGCFDEFNRIAIEVLSVIAVQVKTILDAVKMHKDIFNFMGETIKLITTVGMFITMNPGYAGRAELPENLKALFRPCAMVVPDFALICEIMLVAEGFQEARILARKFITLYNLCKELLSKQDHYDWGLRAIKSVLVVAGSLKRGDRQRPEDQVLMRALRDFNIPKIVTEDVPIFMGLIGDLFPALDVPRKRDVEFETMVKKSAIDLGLQPDDGFILKIVQLEELFAVRHSVFVNGFAGTGKSQVWKTLFRTYQNQKKKPHYNDLNPKAVTNDELFGVINPSTREWRDGLFSVIMRDQANMPGTGPKWIVLDGDIDPMWIESLNTLMDDNKVLTLASNERIALTKEMRLLFEISNLRTATPATVSRAGILYINPQDLGWNPYVMSWIDKRESAQEKSLLTGLFDKYIPPILESAKNRFKKITPISDIAMLQMTCFLLDCLLTPKNVPADVSKELFETYFVFAVIWGFGSTVFKDQLVDWRSEFSKWWLNEFKTIKFPGGGTIFSYYIDHNTKKFSPWTELVQPFELDSDIPLQSTLVSTSETTRLRYFMDMLIEKKQPLMLIGGAGSGKSVIVAEKLNNLSENYMVLNVPFNFYTTSKMLQTVLEKPLEKKAGRNFGPTGNKTMIYFIDDMNMPEVDTYGTVQPHTLVNQFMDYKHWYDREKLSLKDINNCQFISCMNPTAGSFTICPRLQRHFCSFAVNFPGPEALYHIYYSILSQHVSNPINKFNTNFLGRVEAIVNVAIALHVKVGQTFLPTAVKFHYIFNLRDMANIFQGIMFANGDTCRTVQMFYRLYIHEAMRVYGDKLVDRNDIQDFNKMLLDITKSGFESMDEEIVWHLPITFCHFAEGIADPKYATIPEWSVLRKLLDDSLINYNEIVGAMNLVLFEDAMSHICRINRILESPRGNGLLIGVGGSGKQSLTRLAAFISTMDVFQLQLRKGYSMVDLRNDLAALYLKTGIKNQPSIFLMTDSQVADETFLVLINDLLASGEISELFPDDEMENIINTIRNEVKQAGIFDTKENCWKFFIDKVRRTLKIILCFSPVGPTLRIRGRKFPAIVNCTAIDWFHEWPTEALESVSKRFLADLEVLPTHLIDSIGNFMAFVHNSVNEMSSVYLANEKRYNYTTPKSFLELISLYSKLLNEKVASTSERIQTLETGLIKLVACGEQIDGLKDVLKDQEVILIEKNQAADKLIAVVSAENEIVQTEKVFVAEEEAKVQIIKDSVSVTAKVCEEDLRKAQPALLAAQEALNTLNRDNLTELKSFANPPKIVETVLAGVLIFFSKGKIPKDRSWKAAKMMMNKVDVFLNNLLYFDKEHIQPQTIQAVMPYLNDPEFDPELIAKKSSAAAGLCAWVINIHKFYEVWLVVEPKQRALNAVQAELKAAQDKLFILNKKILDLEDQLSVIQMEFDQAMAEKQKCQKEADKTTRTIDLAHRLVNGLASENIRWRETVSQLKTSIEFLPGDVLLISCFISYVGCFTRPYRLELQAKLGLKFKTLDPKIPVGEESDPLKMICDDAIIAQWNNEGLPSDRMSAENATILTNSARWPLMIDPQLQGIKWIKQKYGAKLIVIRLTEPNYVKKIEKSIADGSILLIENIGETVDAVLEPLLGRFLIKKGKCMKIGDAEIDYNPDFRLILQTKLANPHYKPEMQAQTTLINFTVTKDGLEDQLLTEVVKAERPDLEELKSNLTMQQNSFKITLKNLEDDLLRRLSSAGPNVLEDETLVLNLEKTKMTAAEIGVKVAEAKITTVKIDEAREHYRIAAQRAAILYFILNEFFKVNPIYQFSLKAFTVVFKRAIETSPPSENLKERVGILIDNITYNVSQYTTRGLFEKDKIIFLAQLVIQIFVQEGNIAKEELDFLLKYPYQPNVTSPVSFLNNISWGGILSLSSLSNFSSLDKEIESLAKRWKTFVDSETPEKEKYPGEWKSKNALQKMCIMRCLRPDRMIYAIRECIEETLGTKFAEDRTIEFARSFEETSSSTPVFFILSPGVDPLKDVEKLGKVLQFSTENENFYNVSLGQGQEIVAEAAIENASKKGHWVILQNIHLVARWLSTLEKKMEETAEVAHQDYRLFISAEPAGSPEYHIIPQGILESSIKITNEPPSGMQANLHTALDNFSQDTLEMCTKESEFKAILFSLCYFHAVVAERRKFGPQGWNKIYPFNVGDLTICVYVLHNYLEANIRVPWEDLRYLFGEIMYGGHITDDWDRRLCRTYLEVLMQPDLVDGELELCNDFVSPPNSDYQGYHDYISENLPSESPYLYGLHPNAEIGFLTTTAERVFNVLFELQPRDSGASDGVQISREEVVKTKIEDIMDRLPEEYNMVEVMSRVEERTPFIIVAFQECERMNILVREMRRSLNELSLGLKGELTITSDMEMLDQSLYIDKVPDNWTKLAYPSLLGLSSWFADLSIRIQELEAWATDFTLPSSVWLAGFFNPQSFLTAIMQQTARKNEWPLDKMCLNCDVTKKQKGDFTMPPREGAYINGLFMEGARWDIVNGTIADSTLMELFPPMPVIYIKAVTQDKQDVKNIYECPVYKIRMRGPTYVWTFNLKTKEKPSKWTLAGVCLLLQS